MEAKSGDKIKIVCDDKEYTGILVDNKKETTILKLENGYNIGISNSRIKNIELIEKGKELNIEYKSDVKVKKGLPRVSILHTGGTIASKVDYRTGAVYSSFKPEDLLGLFPELADVADLESTLIANMWSDDLRFKHISVMAETVKKEVEKGVDGVIIGIGTDNLAVAAAGLAFMLEECPVPIIFVGAQRSSDRGSSDAAMNLICAAKFISGTDFAGVAICMHDYTSDEKCVVLPACKTRKLHSSRRDAFKAVNDTAIATVDYKTGKINYTKKKYTKRGKNLVVKPSMEEKVGLLKGHANLFAEIIDAYKGYKGLVIEGVGLGHLPGQAPNEWCDENKKIYPALQRLIESGCVVVMTTNTIFGRVNMNVYDKGRDLQEVGVLSGEDMIAETALVKLSWLLGNHSADETKELIGQNLRGEINQNISEKEFLDE